MVLKQIPFGPISILAVHVGITIVYGLTSIHNALSFGVALLVLFFGTFWQFGEHRDKKGYLWGGAFVLLFLLDYVPSHFLR